MTTRVQKMVEQQKYKLQQHPRAQQCTNNAAAHAVQAQHSQPQQAVAFNLV